MKKRSTRQRANTESLKEVLWDIHAMLREIDQKLSHLISRLPKVNGKYSPNHTLSDFMN